MAGNKERTKDDLYIKKQEDRKSKRFFVTGSSKDGDTILTSSFNKASASFAENKYLDDNYLGFAEGGLVYALQQMKEDLDDVYNEVSASAFEASYFPFATVDSGSFGVISSSLVPDRDDKYNLGSSGKEWHTTYQTTASIGGGIFTSASLAAGGGSTDLTAVDSHIVPDGDNTRDLGSSTKEFKNLYIDGVAYIDTLNGTRLTAPIRHVFEQFTKLKSSTLDGTSIEIFEFNIAKAVTVDLITPAHPGQIVTIMNVGSGAVTITRSTKGKQTGIYGQSNLTINQHQVYRFICSLNQIWYVL